MARRGDQPLKLLAWADAGTHTGFATVTHNILERLVSDYGYDVSVLAVNYRGDYWPTNLKLYPATQLVPTDIYGQSRIIDLMGKIMPDAIWMLNDPAVVLNVLLGSRFDTERVVWRGMGSYKPPIIAYLPIDGSDPPSSWNILTERVTRVAMSHFGQKVMPEAPVIWHGVDTTVFRPQNKKEAKRSLGFDPDHFLVLRVDKNSFRKNYPDTWRALRPVLRRYKNIDVHFHCLPGAADGDGYNLNAFIWNDEDIRDRVTFSPNLTGFGGWDQEHLAMLYASADLFVSTSWGEGFGLTILEAMASGTMVLAQDHSSVSEVVGDGGILVPPARRIATPMGQDQWLPDIEKFTYWIENLYYAPGTRRKRAEVAVAQASRFSWDEATRRMDTVIRKSLGEETPDALLDQQRSASDSPVAV